MELDGALLWVVFLQGTAGGQRVTLGEDLVGLALDLVYEAPVMGVSMLLKGKSEWMWRTTCLRVVWCV